MKILMLLDDLLFPVNSGGRFETSSEFKALVNDARVDVKGILFHREPHTRELVSAQTSENAEVHVVKRRSFAESTLRMPLRPYQVSSRHLDKGLISRVTAEWQAPDVILASHEWTLHAAHALSRRFPNAAVVLRSHNNEIEYMHSLRGSEASLSKRLYYLAEERRLGWSFRRLLWGVDAVGLISEHDEAPYGRVGAKTKVLPPILVDAEVPTARPSFAERELAAGFVGALDVPHAVEDLLWFLDEVAPRIRKNLPAFRVVIAGRRASAETQRTLKSYPFVDFLGEVETPRTVLDQVRLFLNPARSGSGVNIKLGPPLSHGVPVLTTSFGMRGLSALQGVAVIGDGAEQQAELSCTVLTDEARWNALSEQGETTIRSTYTRSAFVSNLLALIDHDTDTAHAGR